MSISKSVKEIMQVGELLKKAENKYTTRLDWWANKNLNMVNELRKTIICRLVNFDIIQSDARHKEIEKNLSDLEKQKTENPDSWTPDHEKLVGTLSERLKECRAATPEEIEAFNLSARAEESAEVDIDFKLINVKYLPGWDDGKEKIYNSEELNFLEYMKLVAD